MKDQQIIIIGIILISILMAMSACQREMTATVTPEIELVVVKSTETEEIEVTVENTPTPTSTATALINVTLTPTPTIAPLEDKDIYWHAGFETGNLSEYEDYLGEFLRQSPYGWYQISSAVAKSGQYSAGLTIDTSRLSQSQAAAAYLAFYDNPDEAYYSGWIYIPEAVDPQSWWNIWQWKSTYNGNSDDSLPMWILGLSRIDGNLAELNLSLVYRPDDEAVRVIYENPAARIPKGEWVHISTYYLKSKINHGAVGVWINGEEMFFVENAHTALGDNTLYWSVNNYSDSILPEPCTIYFDDMVISYLRIEPTTVLP